MSPVVTGNSGTQHAQNVGPMLIQHWATVYDAGPTLAQHWANVLCLLGSSLFPFCMASIFFFRPESCKQFWLWQVFLMYLGSLFILLSPWEMSPELQAWPLQRWDICVQTMEVKGVFQFEIITNVLVSPFHFIWIPMLFVHGHYKFFHQNLTSVCRRQILT